MSQSTTTVSKDIYMHQSIQETLRYYGHVHRPLLAQEIVRLSTYPMSLPECEHAMTSMSGVRRVLLGYMLDTTPDEQMSRVQTTQSKVARFSRFFSLLQRTGLVAYIGLTGSCAMDNATAEDDVDIYIITKPQRLFTSRFYALALAAVMGVRRKRGMLRAPHSICMNLWMDRLDLTVPGAKRSLYAARELAQIKTVYDAGGVHEDIFSANQWICDFLPNISIASVAPREDVSSVKVVGAVEYLARCLERAWMRSHITRELVTDTQLWLHPHDRTREA